MYEVNIRNGEIFVRRWNTEIRAHEEKRPDDQSLVPFLQCKITIERTTFAQFMEFIAKDAEVMEVIFRSTMGGYPIKPYLDECKLPDGNPEKLKHLEVYWSAEIDKDEEAQKPSFELYAGFHGWGPWNNSSQDDEGMPKEGGYAIEYTPLNEYKMLELRLDESVSVFDSNNFKAQPLEWTRPFTVYDVVNAILFEITWAGSIENRARRVEEMERIYLEHKARHKNPEA